MVKQSSARQFYLNFKTPHLLFCIFLMAFRLHFARLQAFDSDAIGLQQGLFYGVFELVFPPPKALKIRVLIIWLNNSGNRRANPQQITA